MSKNISTALKNHLAQETTTITTCILFKLVWRKIPIASISNANPAVVTTVYDHKLVTGQYICLDDIVGMTSGSLHLNETPHVTPWKFYTVTVIGDKSFSLDGIDTSTWSAYTSGGRISELVSFTDFSSNIELDGITYDATTGFTKSAVSSDSTMAVDTIDLTGIIGEIGGGMEITSGDVIAGRFDMAEVRVFQINYEDLSMGRMWLKRGWIGQVSVQNLVYTAEIRGMAQMLQNQALELYSANCRYDLGDHRCGFNLLGNMPDTTPATVSGSVTATVDNGTFIDTSRTEITESVDLSTYVYINDFINQPSLESWADYVRRIGITLWTDYVFQYGLLTWTSGRNSGLSKEVDLYTYVGSIIVLVDKMPFTIEVGDEYIVNKGCDKLLFTCKRKFENVLNFGGFPHLPGEDILLRVKQQKSPTVA